MRADRMAAVLVLGLMTVAMGMSASASGIEDWNFDAAIGFRGYERGEAVDSGLLLGLTAGYEYTSRISFEGGLLILPALESRGNGLLEAATGKSDTSAVGITLEALYRFDEMYSVVPFVAAGVGLLFYADDFEDNGGIDPTYQVGGGCLYYTSDQMAIRTDLRVMLAGSDTEINTQASIGIQWKFGRDYGSRRPEGRRRLSRPMPRGAAVDSDSDGLSDAEEAVYGTDPHRRDSDSDGLDDGQEVKKYRSNPSVPDSDMDMLQDGEEAMRYGTDPVAVDSDGGGVTDGHEVLEDGTDPRNPDDDLKLYSLKIKFDNNSATIKKGFASELDIIGKVLKRYPAAAAVIEGHADKRKGSSPRYNQALSEKRARAVLKYLQDDWGIAPVRMKAVGYGFSRPVAPNDPQKGNPRNRRVDVYIEGAGGAGAR